MPKDKKKHSKKDEASDDILELARASVKKFRKVSREIGKLSTGQKLAGGLALAAAGLAYLATRDAADASVSAEPARSEPAETEAEPTKPATPRKRPKRARFAAEE